MRVFGVSNYRRDHTLKARQRVYVNNWLFLFPGINSTINNGNSIPASAKKERNFILVSAKKKTTTPNMINSKRNVGNNPFAVLDLDTEGTIKSTKVAPIKTAKAAPIKTMKATPIKTVQPSTVEYLVNGNTYVFPSNGKKTIIKIGTTSMCASQMYHLFGKCQTTGATKCRHARGLNHHDNILDDLDLTPYMKRPEPQEVRCIPIVQEVKAQHQVVQQVKTRPKILTLTDYIRAGDWKGFTILCAKNPEHKKPRGKVLLCTSILTQKTCQMGGRCAFAHSVDEQVTSLPTKLVNTLAQCSTDVKKVFIRSIRDEIVKVINLNRDTVLSLLAVQSKMTEYNKYKVKEKKKTIAKDKYEKTRDGKSLRKDGKYIHEIPFHKLQEASTTDIFKMWRGLAVNDHTTFALFGRYSSKSSILEDFVWEITRLCAIDPCFTWTYYDAKLQLFIEENAQNCNSEWTTVQKIKTTFKIDPKDMCYGGINCKHGRHTHAPLIDLDFSDHCEIPVQETFEEKTTDFVPLCKPNTKQTTLTEWSKFAAIVPKPDVSKVRVSTVKVSAHSRVTSPVEKPKEVIATPEHVKPKKKKATVQECTDDSFYEGCEFALDTECILPSDMKKKKKEKKKMDEMSILIDLPETAAKPSKREKKNRKKKSVHSAEEFNTFHDSMDDLMSSTTHPQTINVTRIKSSGEILEILMDNPQDLRKTLKDMKAGFSFRLKGGKLVISLGKKNQRQFEDLLGSIFDTLSQAFHVLEIDVDDVLLIDMKGNGFFDQDLTDLTKIEEDKKEETIEERENTLTKLHKKCSWWGSDSESDSESKTEDHLNWCDYE
jgi:hypothetical protein